MQLLRGGARPEIARPELLEVLPLLADDRTFTENDCEVLGAAYKVLRRAENFIQGMRDRQVHDLPSDPVDRARLATAMGAGSWDELESEIAAARRGYLEQARQLARELHAVAVGAQLQRVQHLAGIWMSETALFDIRSQFGCELERVGR